MIGSCVGYPLLSIPSPPSVNRSWAYGRIFGGTVFKPKLIASVTYSSSLHPTVKTRDLSNVGLIIHVTLNVINCRPVAESTQCSNVVTNSIGCQTMTVFSETFRFFCLIPFPPKS